jgi:hypothetical protein
MKRRSRWLLKLDQQDYDLFRNLATRLGMSRANCLVHAVRVAVVGIPRSYVAFGRRSGPPVYRFLVRGSKVEEAIILEFAHQLDAKITDTLRRSLRYLDSITERST